VILNDVKPGTPSEWYEKFSLDKDDDNVNEIISGYNYRTFPKTNRWRSVTHPDFVFVRQGLYVFDYRGKKKQRPEGRITLVRKVGRFSIFLECTIETEWRNSPMEIGEGIIPGAYDTQYSSVCGRCTLRLIDFWFNERDAPVSKATGTGITKDFKRVKRYNPGTASRYIQT